MQNQTASKYLIMMAHVFVGYQSLEQRFSYHYQLHWPRNWPQTIRYLRFIGLSVLLVNPSYSRDSGIEYVFVVLFTDINNGIFSLPSL